MDNNDELTVQYILNRKTKEELATNILKNDTARKKHSELLNIYELLSVVGIEKFNNLSHIYSKISVKDTRKIDDLINVLHSIIGLITEYNTLLEYCNKQFVEISKTYNQSVILIIYKSDVCRYEIKTGKFKETDLTVNYNKKRKGNNNHEASSSSNN